jgi:uncharacterized protein
MTPEEVVAIDAHVHVNDEAAFALRPKSAENMANYFGQSLKTMSLDELADQYRARRMQAVLVNSSDVTATGQKALPNDHIAAAVQKHPDVYFGFGAIDPWLGRLAIDEVRRCKEELGLHGIGELHPGRQQFFPNDPRFDEIWAEAERQRLPVMFHTGMSGAGAGTPGGSGVKLKYTQPIHIDDIAADFPNLPIICAHPSWPWHLESLAMARHKSNVYLDISGWSPKYFPAEVVQQMNSLLQDKVLFGSDWPVIDVDRWLEEFNALDLKPVVRRKVLLENAVALLNGERAAPGDSRSPS